MRSVHTKAIFLACKGLGFFLLSVIDWMTAKAGVSERHYLLPSRVAKEFHSSVVGTLHGQVRRPSLSACTYWNPKAGGPAFSGRSRGMAVDARMFRRP